MESHRDELRHSLESCLATFQDHLLFELEGVVRRQIQQYQCTECFSTVQVEYCPSSRGPRMNTWRGPHVDLGPRDSGPRAIPKRRFKVAVPDSCEQVPCIDWYADTMGEDQVYQVEACGSPTNSRSPAGSITNGQNSVTDDQVQRFDSASSPTSRGNGLLGLKNVIADQANRDARSLRSMKSLSFSSSIDHSMVQASSSAQGNAQGENSPRSRPSQDSQRTDASDLSNNDLELLPLWVESVSPKRGFSTKTVFSASSASQGGRRWSRLGLVATVQRFNTQNSIKSGAVLQDDSIFQYFMMKPSNPFCIFWDLLTALAVFYDTVVVPLDIGFEPVWPEVFVYVTYFISLLWMTDMGLTFIRGFMSDEKGVVEMRPKFIAQKYFKSWFTLDLVVVLADISVTWLNTSDLLRSITLLRLLRLLRLVRLVRIVKITERLVNLSDFFADANATEKTAALANILKLIGILLLINHFIACGWHLVGTIDVDQNTNQWPEQFLRVEDRSNSMYRYMTAFHWSITQFTPASMEVAPQNVIERMYACGCIVLGLLMFSTFISSITQAMMHLRQLNNTERQQSQAVRKYMGDNQISLELSSTIITYIRRYRSRGQKKKRMTQQDVLAFKCLPENLLVKLHDEVFTPALMAHGMFKMIQDVAPYLMTSIAHHAVSEVCLLQGEELFRCGMKGVNMYFVCSGTVSYCLGLNMNIEAYLKPKEWVSEASLWCRWEHRGRVAGEERASCDLLQVQAAQFHRIASGSGMVHELQKYAKLFVQNAGFGRFITDIWTTNAIVQNMVKLTLLDDEEWKRKAAKRLLVAWDTGGDNLHKCFAGWKDATRRSRGLSSAQYRCCLIPLCNRWLRRGNQKACQNDREKHDFPAMPSSPPPEPVNVASSPTNSPRSPRIEPQSPRMPARWSHLSSKASSGCSRGASIAPSALSMIEEDVAVEDTMGDVHVSSIRHTANMFPTEAQILHLPRE